MKTNALLPALSTYRASLRAMPFGTVIGNMKIILPHVLFSLMYQHHREEWIRRVCGGGIGKIKEFWESQTNHPSYASHPMHGHKFSFKKKAVPIAIHADGVTVTGIGKKSQKHMDAFSWTSLLAMELPAAVNSFLIALLFQIVERSDGLTSRQLWTVMSWSFHWMYQGVWPDYDWTGRQYSQEDGLSYIRRGQPLAFFFFGVVWVMRADLDYVHNSFKLGAKNETCHLCQCNQVTIPYTDCDYDACWKSTIWSGAGHAAANPYRHIALQSIPGVSITSFTPDILHIKHLGVDMAYVGAVLQILLDTINPGNENDSLASLWAEIQASYKARKTVNRLNVLTKTMIKGYSKTYPALSARGLQIRDLIPTAKDVWVKTMDQTNQTHRIITRGLEATWAMEEVLTRCREQFALPAEEAEIFHKECHIYLGCITAGIRAYHPRRAYFNFTTKAHILLHLAIAARYCNPSFGSCYDGEIMMGVVRRLIQGTARGSKPLTVANAALERYIHAKSFELTNPQERFIHT